MTHDYKQQAKVMKAFCDENRLKIIALLRGGEQCACMLLEHLDIGQSALSYHMKILVESGVVSSRQDGKWMNYRLCENGSKHALEMLEAMLTPKKEGHAAAAQCKPDAARG